ncbi:hypothetical protein ACFS6H_18575 [Terrimonas rubra]|uniref:AsmA-like C-terminal region n=1 Tax=Terrimonas rubra TaxID=1035890 RepID=A0ABW6AAE0_9BACT
MKGLIKKLRKQTATPKGKIVAFTILGLVLLGIGAGVYYWYIHKQRIIEKEITGLVDNKSNGLYQLKYDDLSLDEINGNLSIKNISLLSDSVKFDSLQQLNEAPNILFDVQIPSLEVSGVKTPAALLNKEIIGTKIKITDAAIGITYTGLGSDSAKNVPTSKLYRQLLGNLNLIKIDTIELSGITLVTKTRKSKGEIVRMSNATIILTDVAVDSIANADTTRILFAKGISAAIDSVQWKTTDNLYRLVAAGLNFDSRQQHLAIYSVKAIPQYDEATFPHKMPFQGDRFDVQVSNLQLENISFSQLSQEKIIADKMIIPKGSLKIYRDKNFLRDKKNRVGTYPHQLLLKAPLPVFIKQLAVQDVFIEYKEKSYQTKQKAAVQFAGTNGTITNLTNINDSLQKNNLAIADLNTNFLNSGALKTKWTFYLGNPNGRFDIEASMGSMPATVASPITEALTKIKVQKGTINSIWLNTKGDDYKIKGQLKILYEDAKVAILKQDEDKTEMKKKPLLTLVANTLIKSDNPTKNKPAREVEIDYTRDTNRSIFTLICKGILEAIMKTAGMEMKEKPQNGH